MSLSDIYRINGLYLTSDSRLVSALSVNSDSCLVSARRLNSDSCLVSALSLISDSCLVSAHSLNSDSCLVSALCLLVRERRLSSEYFSRQSILAHSSFGLVSLIADTGLVHELGLVVDTCLVRVVSLKGANRLVSTLHPISQYYFASTRSVQLTTRQFL